MSDVKIMATLSDGVKVAMSEHMVYPLTACCQASGKGSESPTGVVCRACYNVVPVDMGMGWFFEAEDTDEEVDKNDRSQESLSLWLQSRGFPLASTLALTLRIEATG